jgi:hypothetical protein
VSSPNGTADCSIEVGKTTSKPTTLAPPSISAVSTGASSRVQVTVGVPSNGGVRKVSSSNATTTAGEAAGASGLPNMRQRSAVIRSSERPRSPSQTGEAASRPAASEISKATAAARRRTRSIEAVMRGLVPRIHVSLARRKAWMAGT